MLSRRTLLLGAAAAGLAAPARLGAAAAPSIAAILEAGGLGAVTGFALADLDGGGLLEGLEADVGRPPASVAKVVTSLYALDALGPGYAFATRLVATGPVSGGTLAGDLLLVGGGDPVLDTDGLARLAGGLADAGVKRLSGRFIIVDSALPFVPEIARDQPVDAGYNPAIAGVNLNFNRVELSWTTGGPLVFGAPGEAAGPVPVSRIGGAVGPGPIAVHEAGGREIWSLPAGRVRGSGSDWLPVRRPAPYAGEVFTALAVRAGTALPPFEIVRTAAGQSPRQGLAAETSPPLARLLRDMLRFSTNLTAETIGLRASQMRGERPAGLAASAGAMSAWARTRFDLAGPRLVDHSGLGDASRIAPADMVALLRQSPGLEGLLPVRPVLGADRKPVDLGVSVASKTGTLFFASGLAGFLTGKRRLAFAIFSVDPARRRAIRPAERADPPGSDAWSARARGLEQALLRRWASVYAG